MATERILTRREFLGGLSVAAAGLVVAGCGGGSSGSQGGGSQGGPINATIAGASATGYFSIVGETINSIVRDEYPGSSIAYQPGSPVGSLTQVATGRADLAMGLGPVEEQLGNAGKPPFEEPLEGEYQAIMEIHRKQDFGSIALQSWAERHGIESWDDIADKQPPLRVGINQRGNVQVIKIAETLFGQYGITFDDIEQWGGRVVYQPGGETPGLLQDRKIDMYFNPQFQPITDIVEVANSGVPLTWISMDAEKVEATAEEWGNLTTIVPADTYDWLKQDEPTIRQQSDFVVNPNMPEDEVYRLTKAIFDNVDRMRQIHPAMEDFSAENAVRVKQRVQLHPGAARYYEEQNLA